MRDVRGVLVAGTVWASALVFVFVPQTAGPAAISALLGSGVLLVLARRRRGTGLAVLMLLCCAGVGMVVASAHPARAALSGYEGRAVELVVRVDSSASPGADGRLWFDATALASGVPGRAALTDDDLGRAPVRIGIVPITGVDLGATLRVSGSAAAADPGERAALVVFGAEAQVVSPPSGVFAVAAATRAAFVTRSSLLPGAGADLLPGLAVGDTRAIPDELDAAMIAAGLSHLTAVSGANCAIVVAAVFWLVARLGAGRGWRVALGLAALAAFVVLVTPEPSVVRAAVMSALAMLAVLLGRPGAGVAMLSLAVSGILLADPWMATAAGFALSAAATAALLLLSRPLMAGMERWMPRFLAVGISVPLAAQLVCGPIIALFADRQSLIGVAANLLAAPAAPIATVVGLLACLAAPLPMLADLLAAVAWLPASWIAATATVSAALPGATIPVVPGPVAAAAVGVLSAAVAILLMAARARRLRVASAFVVSLAVAVAGARLLLAGPVGSLTVPGDWSVAVCDVGQGDAVIVRSGGRTALFDAGPDPGALSACLGRTGTQRIDLLVLTHFDRDHVGGVPALEGRVGAVVHGPVASDDERRLLQRLVDGGATLTIGAVGVHGALGAASWRVVWPMADSVAFEPGNDSSVVVEIGGGGVPRTLLLGDLSASPQRVLSASGRVTGTYDLVKVSHHGSADQEPALYASIGPAAAIIGVGEPNGYGHPRSETLAMLQALGAEVLRTDERGLMLLSRSEHGLSVWSERGVAR